MKKNTYLIVLIILFFSSCSERANIKIDGSLHCAERDYIYLDYLNINKTENIDSVRIKKDGSFHFAFYSESPGIYILRNANGKIISLLPSPDEHLIIEADNNKFNSTYSVAGSKESEYIRQLVEKLLDTRSRINALNENYETPTNLNDEQASSYITQLKAITKEQRDFSIQFIIEHLNSISSIYALYQEISDGQFVLGNNYDIQYMKIVADSVSKYYPDVDFVNSFVSDARMAEKQFYNLKDMQDKLKNASTTVLDLNLSDTNNENVRLSSLKGKTVLLYFWSSKSEDCKNLNLSLNKIYEENKNKGFEIYAVALENDKNEWLNAIRFDELNWINVSELSYPESEAAQLYNVNVIPANFLYNKDGEIVARNIYAGELQKWLDNIL